MLGGEGQQGDGFGFLLVPCFKFVELGEILVLALFCPPMEIRKGRTGDRAGFKVEFRYMKSVVGSSIKIFEEVVFIAFQM